MYVRSGEKKMFKQAAVAMAACSDLWEVLDELDSFSYGKRAVSTAETYLNKINKTIVDRGKHKLVKKIKAQLRGNNRIRITHTLSEDQKCQDWFSRYFIIYVALRDYVNYYSQNNFIPKKVLSGAKRAKTLVKNAFEKDAKSAELNWEAIHYILENKQDDYEYEGKVVIV